MSINSVGFIGAGRVTRIFLKAFENRNFRPKRIVVYDTNEQVLGLLKSQFPDAETVSAPGEAASQDILFIALHPPAIIDTLDMIKGIISKRSIVVSLAPKISVAKMKGRLGTDNIARIIPNATSYINEGYNPVCFADSFERSREEVLGIFELLGNTFEVAEKKLEGYAIISAMLPTYFWFQWKTLEEIGEKTGLDKGEAAEAIYQTVVSSLNLLFKSGLDTDTVIDLIPVKPLGEEEEGIRKIYNDKLTALFEKISPV